jgi:hypothetical protein
LPLPIIPYFSVFDINMSSTQSNAFVRSHKRYLPLFVYCLRHLILHLLVFKPISVVNPLWNPYCSLLMMMFLCKWSSNLVCITFSKIFEIEIQ